MRFFLLLFILLLWNCDEDNSHINPIIYALQSETSQIQNVMKNPVVHEVQIKLSTISTINDSVVFKDYEFQVDDNTYFYPASTVKLPITVLTLEKLNEDGQYNLDTSFFVEGDSTSTTFRHEIRDIFAISSNMTYNRLFEYLSKDYINTKLKEKGLVPSRISHRLSTTDADDLTTRPLIFLESDSILLSTEAIINKPIVPLQIEKVIKGRGFYSNEELVDEPMDFSRKNYLPLSTIHDMMKRIMFPQNFKKDQRFNLTKEDRDFLVETMSIFPKDEGYLTEEYYDSYGKFFIFGDTKSSIPDHLKIHNKVGYAYGYLTDCAYIIDSMNNIQFILTATIHVNKNGIFNDDIYEYDTIGIPFLAQLGREIHQYLKTN